MFWYTHHGVVFPAEQKVEGTVRGARVLFRATAKGLTDRNGRRWVVDTESGRAYRRDGGKYFCVVGLEAVAGWTHRAEVFTGLPGCEVEVLRTVFIRPDKPSFKDSRGDVWRVSRQNGNGCRFNSETQRHEHLGRAVEMYAEGHEIAVKAGPHVEFVPPVREKDLDEAYNNGTLESGMFAKMFNEKGSGTCG